MSRFEGNIQEIYDAYCSYYGEANIDFHEYPSADYSCYTAGNVSLDSFTGYYVLIHWNEVEVRNEQDETVMIWGVYALLFIDRDGRIHGSPTFNRNIYNMEQLLSGYVHSHLYSRSLRTISEARKFTLPCFGTSSIRSTIDKLHNEYDIDMWRLLCWELDKFIHVESLNGGPYFRMSAINARIGKDILDISNAFINDFISRRQQQFLKDLCKIIIDAGILKFSYVDSQYVVVNDDAKTVIEISDCFIKKYNDNKELRKKYDVECLEKNFILKKAYLYNDKLYASIDAISGIEMVDTDNVLFKFKGNDIRIELNSDSGKCNLVHIINPKLLAHLIYQIQKFININYGREKAVIEENARII